MCIIPINKNDRVGIFIDNNNLRASTGAERLCSRLNYLELISVLKAGRDLRFVDVHDSFRYKDDGSINYSLPNYLAGEGFTLCFRDSFDPVNKVQKEVDVALGVDMVTKAVQDSFDVMVLVSGDRDLVPAVEAVKSMGKTVEIASFDGCISEKLRHQGIRYWNLSDTPIVEMLSPVYPTSMYAKDSEAIANDRFQLR